MGSLAKSYMRTGFLIYKVWWPNATRFAFIFLYTGDTFIHHSFNHKHTLRPISISSQLSAQWAETLWVPSRDSNSGRPYSKPACYQLSHTAP